MKNFLQSDIVWESRKEILVSPHPRKIAPLVQSCQRDPEALALSLINQDLLYLKKGNSGPEKIVLSLHKFPAIIFNDDDIEERPSRWVNKMDWASEVEERSERISVRSGVSGRWERVHDFQLGIESYQQKINLTTPIITFPGIEEYDVFPLTSKLGYESCNGPHYTKDCPLKEEGKTFEEAYYTQFGVPFPQGGRYRVAAPGFYQRDNGNPSHQERRQTMEESLNKFMAESAKLHDENSNLIKEI
ncbi:hypothetical protein Tco_0947788 [Tanacetum coccineum]